MHLIAEKGQDKAVVWANLLEIHAHYLEVAEWFDKGTIYLLAMILLENWFSQFDITTNNAYESTNNAYIFPMKDIWLYLTSIVSSMHINQQFSFKRANWSQSVEMLSNFVIG